MTLGPIQLRRRLNMPEWQFLRARQLGLIPAPTENGRWTDDAVNDVLGRLPEVTSKSGAIPDCGAYRAAEYLSARFGREIPAHVIYDLHRLGHIPEAGEYKGATMYSGVALEAFNDAEVIEQALLDGQLFTADQAASFLRIRRSDFGWLLKLGLLSPKHWAPGRYQTAGARPNVALYRAADLEELLRDERIDWAKVRGVDAKARSFLADLRGNL